jgi:hypothetical protein
VEQRRRDEAVVDVSQAEQAASIATKGAHGLRGHSLQQQRRQIKTVQPESCILFGPLCRQGRQLCFSGNAIAAQTSGQKQQSLAVSVLVVLHYRQEAAVQLTIALAVRLIGQEGNQ